ncbi:hypothetical protein ACLOJK_004471, partial [Asimina triloba]
VHCKSTVVMYSTIIINDSRPWLPSDTPPASCSSVDPVWPKRRRRGDDSTTIVSKHIWKPSPRPSSGHLPPHSCRQTHRQRAPIG